MDFELANQYAERIRAGETGKLRQDLVAMCTQYLLSLRKRLGFYCIPIREVWEELASDAVSDAILVQYERKLPFAICLQNTFRDCCRQRARILRESYMGDLVKICEVRGPSSVIGFGTQPSLPDVQAQQNEQVALANTILEGHPPFSKKLVYQRTDRFEEFPGVEPQIIKIITSKLKGFK